MRAGNCTIQQALTPEAAVVVKQAVTVAKRRRHAQVTPLHVASTMLSPSSSLPGSGSGSGLFRNACLQSHSHPLQCKALELCFNVALNRLPPSASTPMLGGATYSHHHQDPSISNALVAAFKRAQAHQRRGCIENQQQAILTSKIDLEQLIISILDDPSVSRVMREAGFSSTQVKSNVEQVVSLDNFSSKTNPKSQNHSLTGTSTKSSNKEYAKGNSVTSPQTSSMKVSKESMINLESIGQEEDVMGVIESLVDKRMRSLLIIGECLDPIEGVIKGLMEKINKGNVHEALMEVKFVTFDLSSHAQLSMKEIDQKLQDLKALVGTYMVEGFGVVLNLGDLKWAIEGNISNGSMELLISEIGKLLANYSGGEGNVNNGRFWVIGIATFQTYIKCKSSYPSLEPLWGLQSINIPSGILSLSLTTQSDVKRQSNATNKGDGNRPSWINSEDKQVSSFVNSELGSLTSITRSPTSNVSSWLQDCVNSCKKSITFSSLSPSSSTSCFTSHDGQNPDFHRKPNDWSKESWRKNISLDDPSLEMCLSNHICPKPTSSIDMVMEIENNDHHNFFKKLNPENLESLGNALEKKVPWQKEILPEIARTILQCRSRMVRRNNYSEPKEDTWLLFEGLDVEGKEKIAHELARIVFGSHNNFVLISSTSFHSSSSRADSNSNDGHHQVNNGFVGQKRSRDEQQSCSFLQRFIEEVSNNPSRVFFIEDVEQCDYCSQLGLKRAIERGRMSNLNGDDQEFNLYNAIIILSSESFNSRSSRACSPLRKQQTNRFNTDEDREDITSLDLNISISDCQEVDHSMDDDIGLVESVDGRFVFKVQEL